jgi:hypothetical protein
LSIENILKLYALTKMLSRIIFTDEELDNLKKQKHVPNFSLFNT